MDNYENLEEKLYVTMEQLKQYYDWHVVNNNFRDDEVKRNKLKRKLDKVKSL